MIYDKSILASGAIEDDNGKFYVRTNPADLGAAIYGPYQAIGPGRYKVSLQIMPDSYAGESEICCVVDVVKGEEKILEQGLTVGELRSKSGVIDIEFLNTSPGLAEYRVFATGNAGLRIADDRVAVLISEGSDNVSSPANIQSSSEHARAVFHQNYPDISYMAQFGADFEVGERLIARYNNIRVNIDNTEDVQIFKEVFFGNEYRFVSPSDCVVIDIGMNVGMASLAFAANTRVQKVYAFEPFRGPYLRARRNFELNVELSKKIEVRNCGLSNRAEQLSVKSDELSSIGTSVKGTNSGRIETIDLRDASEELKDCFREAKERNLKIVCKVDCEGSEFPIFESLDKSGMFREIDAVVMEWHKTWSEDKNQGDLIGPLMKAEFLTFDRSNPANDQTGFLISVRLSDNASPVAFKKSYPSVRNALARITGLAASASRGAVQARPRR